MLDKKSRDFAKNMRDTMIYDKSKNEVQIGTNLYADGNFTANSIIENMKGYRFEALTKTNAQINKKATTISNCHICSLRNRLALSLFIICIFCLFERISQVIDHDPISSFQMIDDHLAGKSPPDSPVRKGLFKHFFTGTNRPNAVFVVAGTKAGHQDLLLTDLPAVSQIFHDSFSF